MNNLKCPDCGQVFSAVLSRCPQCGCPASLCAALPAAASGGAVCPECGCPLPAGAVVCPECGSPVSAVHKCEACGSPVPAGATVCPSCGCPVSTEPASPPNPRPEPQATFTDGSEETVDAAEEPVYEERPSHTARNIVIVVLVVLLIAGGVVFYFVRRAAQRAEEIAAGILADSVAADSAVSTFVFTEAGMPWTFFRLAGTMTDENGSHPIEITFEAKDNELRNCIYKNVALGGKIRLEGAVKGGRVVFEGKDGNQDFRIELDPADMTGWATVGSKLLRLSLGQAAEGTPSAASAEPVQPPVSDSLAGDEPEPESEPGFHSKSDVFSFVSGREFRSGDISLSVSRDGVYANGNLLGGSPRVSSVSLHSAVITAGSLRLRVDWLRETITDLYDNTVYYAD